MTLSQSPIDIPTELSRIRTVWPTGIKRVGSAPAFDWDEWLEEILAFTHHPEHELMVRGAVTAIAAESKNRASYLVLEQLLIVAIAAHGQRWSFPDIAAEEPRML